MPVLCILHSTRQCLLHNPAVQNARMENLTRKITKDTDPKTLKNRNERLTWARIQRNFDDATSAARELGMKPPTYLAHENGSRGFPVDRVLRYATFFRVDPNWLLTGNGDPKSGSLGRMIDASPEKIQNAIEGLFQYLISQPQRKD